uniref:THAP-type domain-containing protein n=1 Tax=Cyprinus carpio TaxID=7962 RepID=A0A8C1QZH4_CYPCA
SIFLDLRREGFSASESSVLCSEHFKPEDFDRTGQIVRIRDGAKPSIFSFPPHLQRPLATRKTKASRKAEESWSVDCSQDFQEDHSYALSASPAGLKTRLCEALARVESLEHELRNVKDRERRAKKTVYLSVMGFIINIDTLMLLIPELLQIQRYVCTYRFSQDHLELLFNSIRASGKDF